MLQANLYDDNALGWGISSLNPISAAKDAAGYVKDKAVTAGTWVVDKSCASTRDPKVQVAMAAAAAVPSGYTQATAAGYVATGAACAALWPQDIPAIPGPPLDPTMMDLSQFPAVKFMRADFNATKPTVYDHRVIPGTIAAFDPKRGAYRVAVPGLPGLSAPAAFTEVSASATKPDGAQIVPLKTFEAQTGTAKPWYKKPLVLGGIAAGVLVVGGGSYLVFRG